jgi:hypothetical protein
VTSADCFIDNLGANELWTKIMLTQKGVTNATVVSKVMVAVM